MIFELHLTRPDRDSDLVAEANTLSEIIAVWETRPKEEDQSDETYVVLNTFSDELVLTLLPYKHQGA